MSESENYNGLIQAEEIIQGVRQSAVCGHIAGIDLSKILYLCDLAAKVPQLEQEMANVIAAYKACNEDWRKAEEEVQLYREQYHDARVELAEAQAEIKSLSSDLAESHENWESDLKAALGLLDRPANDGHVA